MSWLSQATGIHVGGKHQKLIDVKRLGTNAAEAGSWLLGNPELIPIIEGASRRYLNTDGNVINDAVGAYGAYRGFRNGQGGGAAGGGNGGGGTDWRAILRGIGGAVGLGGGQGGGAGQTALQALAEAEGAYDAAQAYKLRGQAIHQSEQNYKDRDQFRALANSRLGASAMPNVHGAAINTNNPFANPAGFRPVLPSQPPQQPSRPTPIPADPDDGGNGGPGPTGMTFPAIPGLSQPTLRGLLHRPQGPTLTPSVTPANPLLRPLVRGLSPNRPTPLAGML